MRSSASRSRSGGGKAKFSAIHPQPHPTTSFEFRFSLIAPEHRMYKPKYGMSYYRLSRQIALLFTHSALARSRIRSFRTVTKTAQLNPAFACGRASRMKGPRESPCYSRYQYLTCLTRLLLSFLVLSIPKVLPSPHVVNELSWLSKENCHPTPGDAVH